jgi:hypothetical protein
MNGLTIISPTQGRDTLARMLSSAGPLGPDDEWLIMVDAFELPPSELGRIAALAEPFGATVVGVDAGRHTWGHDQLNAGLERARAGNYIVFMDDDDVFSHGALSEVRAAMRRDVADGGPRLHFWQFLTPWRSILPVWPDLREAHVGGHCIVTPNLPGMVARFGPEYNGDYTYIRDTLALWGGVDGGRVAFHPSLIAITRPD